MAETLARLSAVRWVLTFVGVSMISVMSRALKLRIHCAESPEHLVGGGQSSSKEDRNR